MTFFFAWKEQRQIPVRQRKKARGSLFGFRPRNFVASGKRLGGFRCLLSLGNQFKYRFPEPMGSLKPGKGSLKRFRRLPSCFLFLSLLFRPYEFHYNGIRCFIKLVSQHSYWHYLNLFPAQTFELEENAAFEDIYHSVLWMIFQSSFLVTFKKSRKNHSSTWELPHGKMMFTFYILRVKTLNQLFMI